MDRHVGKGTCADPSLSGDPGHFCKNPTFYWAIFGPQTVKWNGEYFQALAGLANYPGFPRTAIGHTCCLKVQCSPLYIHSKIFQVGRQMIGSPQPQVRSWLRNVTDTADQFHSESCLKVHLCGCVWQWWHWRWWVLAGSLVVSLHMFRLPEGSLSGHWCSTDLNKPVAPTILTLQEPTEKHHPSSWGRDCALFSKDQWGYWMSPPCHHSLATATIHGGLAGPLW